MDTGESASRLLRKDETAGFRLVDVEESTGMDFEENHSTPMDIEECASRLLRKEESGFRLVDLEESTRMDIKENQ